MSSFVNMHQLVTQGFWVYLYCTRCRNVVRPPAQGLGMHLNSFLSKSALPNDTCKRYISSKPESPDTLFRRGAVVHCPQLSSLPGFFFAHTPYRTQLHNVQKSVVSYVQPGLVFTDASGIEKRLHSSQVLVLPEPAIETNERERACFTTRSPLLMNLLQQLLLRRSSIHRSPGACAAHKRQAFLFHPDTWTRA